MQIITSFLIWVGVKNPPGQQNYSFLLAFVQLIQEKVLPHAKWWVNVTYVTLSLSLPVFCWWIGEWRRRSKVERQNRVVAVSLVAERMDRAEANRQRTLFVFAYPANPPPPLATPYTKLYKSQATRWRKHWARFPPRRSRRACQSSWRPSWSSESDLK